MWAFVGAACVRAGRRAARGAPSPASAPHQHLVEHLFALLAAEHHAAARERLSPHHPDAPAAAMFAVLERARSEAPNNCERVPTMLDARIVVGAALLVAAASATQGGGSVTTVHVVAHSHNVRATDS